MRPYREFVDEFRRGFRRRNFFYEIFYGIRRRIRRGIRGEKIKWFARVILLLDRTLLFIYIILIARTFVTIVCLKSQFIVSTLIVSNCRQSPNIEADITPHLA